MTPWSNKKRCVFANEKIRKNEVLDYLLSINKWIGFKVFQRFNIKIDVQICPIKMFFVK
jgi:hypothetical protein